MAWLPDADQSGFLVPRFHSGSADCPRFSVVHGSGATQRRAWRAGNSGVAELLFQVTYERPRPLSGTRPFHSIDEAEEHTPSSTRRRVSGCAPRLFTCP